MVRSLSGREPPAERPPVIGALGGGEIPFRSEPIPTYLPWGTTISRPYGGTRRDLQQVVALAQKGRIKVHGAGTGPAARRSGSSGSGSHDD